MFRLSIILAKWCRRAPNSRELKHVIFDDDCKDSSYKLNLHSENLCTFKSRYMLCSLSFTLQSCITINFFSKTQVRSTNSQKVFSDEFQQALIILLLHPSIRLYFKVHYFPELLKWRHCFLLLVSPTGFRGES